MLSSLSFVSYHVIDSLHGVYSISSGCAHNLTLLSLLEELKTRILPFAQFTGKGAHWMEVI